MENARVRVPTPVLSERWRRHDLGPAGVLWVRGDSRVDPALIAAVRGSGLKRRVLRSIGGHFGAVLQRPDSVVLVADAIRSYPLVYVAATAECADDGLRLAVGHDLDPAAANEFRHVGYVGGADTLFAGVRQVLAGQMVTLRPGRAPQARFFRRKFFTGPETGGDPDQAAQQFSTALTATMDRMLAGVDGRQLVVPLSGGLDSRLLLCHLKDVGYDNLITFTYGISDTTPEALISKQVAEAVGARWVFVDYERQALTQAWRSAETARFLRYGSGGVSLPHIQDWYAVRQLVRGGLIDQDAVFLPGHTMVGNMHDEGILDLPVVGRDRIAELLIRNHHSIAPGTDKMLRDYRLRSLIERFLDGIDYADSVNDRRTAIEYWNLRERQAKYINNSVRVYEFFGHDWALPMLDLEMYRLWTRFPVAFTRNRDWYGGYVAQRYLATTGKQLGTFTTGPSNARRALVRRVLERTGLLTTAERTIRWRAIREHPLGFNWFAFDSSPAQMFATVLRGGTPMGLWARSFLAGTWHPSGSTLRPGLPGEPDPYRGAAR